MRSCAILVPLAYLLIVLPGCSCDILAPPFDTTGSYEGSWEGEVSGLSNDYTCQVNFDIDHNAGGALEVRYTLTGTLRLNFTCQQTIRELVPLGFPAFFDFSVTGFLDPEGTFIFISTDCEEFACDGVIISARGADDDDDGLADRLEGSFSTLVQLRDGPRTLSGTFTADRES